VFREEWKKEVRRYLPEHAPAEEAMIGVGS
jgi:hypothetical protein